MDLVRNLLDTKSKRRAMCVQRKGSSLIVDGLAWRDKVVGSVAECTRTLLAEKKEE